jgi:hypothetical protein
MPSDAELLIGRWILTGEEVRTAEFHADGTMRYTIEVAGRTLEMPLTWSLEDGFLVSEPNGVRSRYELPDAETLVLRYEGETFTYRRA